MDLTLHLKGWVHNRVNDASMLTADHLNISKHAVNMRWRTIYNRILQHPELAAAIFDHRDTCKGGGANTQKRRRAIAFMRAHPEELRPFAR